MATADQVVLSHYRRRQRLATLTAAQTQAIWDGFDLDNLDGSFVGALGPLLEMVVPAQLVSAGLADEYVDEVLGAGPRPAGRVVPAGFAGVASDGRPLQSLLYQPVVTAKMRIATGATLDEAAAAGRFALGRIVATQITDAGRVADGVAVAARPRVRYVRVLVPPSCARCAVLAGRVYGWNDGFQRHPSCDCVHRPSRDTDRSALVSSPRAYFDSLDAGEQDRIFTTAGAEAIREGADISQVVNARRGMDVAGRFTTEGATVRGFAGRRLARAGAELERLPGARYRSVRTPRLMPEAIFDRTPNREQAVAALRRHGFIV